jgi:hypothetical protein
MRGHNIALYFVRTRSYIREARHKHVPLPAYQPKHVTRKSSSNVHRQINVYNCWRLKQTYATFQNILVLALVKPWQRSEVNLFFSSVKQLSSEHWKGSIRGVSNDKSGSLRFSQFSDYWLILSVYIIMSFDFPFVRLFGVR